MKNAMYSAILASQKGGRNSKGVKKIKKLGMKRKKLKPQVEGRGTGKAMC